MENALLVMSGAGVYFLISIVKLTEENKFSRPTEFVKPKVSESMDMEPNPILWTWFIIAVMVAVTMICIVFFSMWVYSQRIARVRELRAALYEGYEPSEPEPIKKEADVEAAKPAPEEASKQHEKIIFVCDIKVEAFSSVAFESYSYRPAQFGIAGNEPETSKASSSAAHLNSLARLKCVIGKY
ncbi:hypothetical protein Hamer_G005775, partial [Homarus americanus]